MIPNIEICGYVPCWQWVDYDYAPVQYDTLEPYIYTVSLERREILVTEI